MAKFTALIILALSVGLVGCKRDTNTDSPPNQEKSPTKTAAATQNNPETTPIVVENKSEIPQKPETDITPAETKSVNTPAENITVTEEKPAQIKPVLIGPIKVTPVETKPAEIKPIEVKPTEIKSVEVKPVKTNTAKPAETGNKTTSVKDTVKNDKKKTTPSLKDMKFFKDCDFVFKNFVDKNGRVNYLKLRRKKIELLNACKEVAKIPEEMRLLWSKEDDKAFLLNAHNILMLKLIIDNYPIKPNRWAFLYPTNSIKQLGGAREKTFFRVAGFRYTLNEIEEELLKISKDPRYCFAVSNATVSGGILRNEAYDPNKLDKQLDEQVKKYLANPKNLKINSTEKKVNLSSIFKLKNFTESFLKSRYATIKRFRDKSPEERAFLNFIYLNIEKEKAEEIEMNNYDIKFEKYDWLLNEQSVR
jgi:hypothetical protein